MIASTGHTRPCEITCLSDRPQTDENLIKQSSVLHPIIHQAPHLYRIRAARQRGPAGAAAQRAQHLQQPALGAQPLVHWGSEWGGGNGGVQL